jgi:hypothetical protein
MLFELGFHIGRISSDGRSALRLARGWDRKTPTLLELCFRPASTDGVASISPEACQHSRSLHGAIEHDNWDGCFCSRIADDPPLVTVAPTVTSQCLAVTPAGCSVTPSFKEGEPLRPNGLLKPC